MASITVPSRVGVVLEQVDRAANVLFGETFLGVMLELFEYALTGAVVNHDIVQRIAFRGRIFGMGAHVQIEPGSVVQEHVRTAAPGDDLAKEISSDLVGAQTALSAQGARDAVLGLQSEDPSFEGAGGGQIADLVSGVQ